MLNRLNIMLGKRGLMVDALFRVKRVEKCGSIYGLMNFLSFILLVSPLIGNMLGFPDDAWRLITRLGDETVYFALSALIYIVFNPSLGIQLFIVLATTSWLNIVLKNFFAMPRPPKDFWKVEAGGYGFPSGHVQTVTSYCFYLLFSYRRLELLLLSMILTTYVAFSRVYLGVHYIHDVVGGFIFGAITALAVFKTMKFTSQLTWRRETLILVSYSLVVSLLYVNQYNDAFLKIGGVLLGYSLYPMVNSRFKVKETSLILKFTVAGCVGGAIYFLLKIIRSLQNPLSIFMSYTLISLLAVLSPLSYNLLPAKNKKPAS
ncbi:MAG: hypothetical protein DRJ47_07645 [Thermoprotei archaeon]|nr:MAG: hypothetical protein DRJ47_07645 [Thermoprotei archaeon]